jgi:calcium-binding protein CML
LIPHCVSFKGTSHGCPCGSPNKYKRLDAKLERKMAEAKRGSSGHHNFKSLDSIIMKFPQFKEGLKKIRAVFEQYGKS